MKGLSNRRSNNAMTLLEVLVVILVVGVVIAMVIPMYRPGKIRTMSCFNNLRQIDLAFLLYAEDYHGKFPMQTSVTNGGTMEFLDRNQTFPHYQKLSQYGASPKLLICPLDKNRSAATNYQALTDANLSYFLNADVSTNNVSILAGDRNLKSNGKAVAPGLFRLTTNLDMSFTSDLHPFGGVLAFADGHVEGCPRTNLNRVVQRQNIALSRLSIP